MDNEILRIFTLGSLSLGDLCPKFERHSNAVLFAPILCLALQGEVNSGLLRISRVSTASLRWLAARSQLLSCLVQAEDQKLVAYAFDRKPEPSMRSQSIRFTFTNFVGASLIDELGEQDRISHQDQPQHNLPQVRELFALLASTAAKNAEEFLLACATLHVGLKCVAGRKLRTRKRVISRICTKAEICQGAVNMLSSYAPGLIREQLNNILIEPAPVMLNKIITGLQQSAELPWLKVASDGAVRVVVRKLLSVTMVSDEKMAQSPPMQPDDEQLGAAYTAVLHVLAADVQRRGTESLCARSNQLQTLQDEILHRTATPSSQAGMTQPAQPAAGAIRVKLPPKDSQLPGFKEIAAGPNNTDAVAAVQAARGIASGALHLEKDATGSYRLVKSPQFVGQVSELPGADIGDRSAGAALPQLHLAPSIPNALASGLAVPTSTAPQHPVWPPLPLGTHPATELPGSAQRSSPPQILGVFEDKGANDGPSSTQPTGNQAPASVPVATTIQDSAGLAAPAFVPLTRNAHPTAGPAASAYIPLPTSNYHSVRPGASACVPPPTSIYHSVGAGASAYAPLPTSGNYTAGPSQPRITPIRAPTASFARPPQPLPPVDVVMEMAFEGTEPVLKPLVDSDEAPSNEQEADRIDDSDAEASLLSVLPEEVKLAVLQCVEDRAAAATAAGLSALANKRQRVLIEVVMDRGRNVVLLFLDGSQVRLPCLANIRAALQTIGAGLRLMEADEADEPVKDALPPQDNAMLVKARLTVDNRMGIPGTLHRISAIWNRTDRIVGLTCRVGRHVTGRAKLLQDVIGKVAPQIDAHGSPGSSGASLLLLGPPGVGKTTLLRDIICMLANKFELGASVMVVDTSNEIGGYGDIPHPAIGHARRVSVQDRTRQHKELLEAVQNHTPAVVVVDEVSTTKEAEAIKAVGHRGAVMVATAHGNSIRDLVKNPELVQLVGGVSEVTVGDRAAARTRSGNKTKLERTGPPVFQIVVEVLGFDSLRVHLDSGASIDAVLQERAPCAQRRWLNNGRMAICFEGAQSTSILGKRRPSDAFSQPLPRIVKHTSYR